MPGRSTIERARQAAADEIWLKYQNEPLADRIEAGEADNSEPVQRHLARIQGSTNKKFSGGKLAAATLIAILSTWGAVGALIVIWNLL